MAAEKNAFMKEKRLYQTYRQLAYVCVPLKLKMMAHQQLLHRKNFQISQNLHSE